MLNPRKKQPIKVGILEVSTQNRALLAFYFDDAGKSYFKEVDVDQASCFIIDYDSPSAKDSWETTFKEKQKPGIIISIKEVKLPSTVWIAKPLTVKALTDASVAIKEMIVAEEAAVETVEESISETTVVVEEPLENIEDEKSVVVTQEIEAEKTEEKEISELDELILNAWATDETEENIASLESNDLKADSLELEINLDELEVSSSEVQIEKEIEKKVPELAIAGASAAASSKSFSVSPELIHIDSILENPDLLTKKTNTPDVSKNDNEIDSLLESLVTDEANDESVENEAETLTADDTLETDLPELNFELETIEIEPEEDPVVTHNNDDDDETNSKTDELTATLESLQSTNPSDENTDVENFDDTEELIVGELLDAAEENIDTPPESKSVVDSTKSASRKSAEEELQSLLEEIRHEADGSNSGTQGNKAYLPTPADERWELTCGKGKEKQNLKSLCTIAADEHILSTLIENIRKAKKTKTVLRIKFNNILVVIDPETDSVYCDESIFSKYYADVCHGSTNKTDIKVHNLDASEIRLYRNKIKAGSKRAHSIESFIWTTSLVTHCGYLPVGTDLNKKLDLKSWPNLTRLENIPHSIQIAAIFQKHSKSLAEITKELDIPKKYIISFYNATLSLDFITRASSAYSAPISPAKSVSKENKGRGFFSRFIKKLNT